MMKNWNGVVETKSNNRRQVPNIRGDLSKPPVNNQNLFFTWYALEGSIKNTNRDGVH